MKIKILKTGEIVDALIDSLSTAIYLLNGGAIVYKNESEYEIIKQQRQYKFNLGDMVFDLRYPKVNFKVNRIVIDADCEQVMYGSVDTYGYLEKYLTLYTEPVICSHSVGTRQDRTPEWIVSVNWDGQIICEHCGVELVAEWKEKV